jgi:hypothetical protein
MPMADELRALYEDVLRFPSIGESPSLAALFKYLWERKEIKSQTVNVWEECLYAVSRSKDKDLPRDQYDYERPVRERCKLLRKALQEYSSRQNAAWIVDLPSGIPTQGYQLRLVQKRNEAEGTFIFWRDHLSCNSDVCLVYVEFLFFQSWRNRYVISYHDCVEEHPALALEELKKKHPEAYDQEINVAYPFVSAGEIEARDLIAEWFDKHAMVRLKTAVTRRRNDKDIWNDSLILFGERTGHKMIAEVLNTQPDLEISLTERWVTLEGRTRGQVKVKNPTEEELKRFARFMPERKGAECLLHFSPQEGTVLVIVTRVPNPYSRSVVTIINADFGRAIDQVAALLTDKERMNSKEWPKLGNSPAHSFQVLYAIPVRSFAVDYLPAKELEPLAWREYP